MLSFREAGHVVREDRPEAGTKEFLEEVEHTVHTVCARTPEQEDLVQQMTGVCRRLQRSLKLFTGMHIRRPARISMVFRSTLPKGPGELGGQPGAL